MNVARFCGLGLIGLVSLQLGDNSLSKRRALGWEAGKTRLEIGTELFVREWKVSDNRSFDGDGLGPLFNERSCARCHDQGGVGGSGRKENNAVIVSAFVDLSGPRMLTGVPPDPPDPNVPVQQPAREKLAAIHPALRNENSFPLHRFSNDRAFESWKAKHKLESSIHLHWNDELKVDNVRVALIHSSRNTPALFGAGLIDQIPRSAMEKVAIEQGAPLAFAVAVGEQVVEQKEAPGSLGIFLQTSDRIPLPISGRVATLKDGKIGKFGWKASVASLHEFTLQACANEIGLEVPGVAQAMPPWVKDYKAPGFDLSADQCLCLTEFIASLPRPVASQPDVENQSATAAGRKLFGKLGCATCHRPKLGDVEEIYSDLLLHDMGQTLSGSGFYGTNVEFVKAEGKEEPLPINRDMFTPPKREIPPKFGAGAREWRTPPLWGVADSAPYLHDGRAATLVDAIKQHDGEGATAAIAFDASAAQDQNLVLEFLQSLRAPKKEH